LAILESAVPGRFRGFIDAESSIPLRSRRRWFLLAVGGINAVALS